MNEVYIGIVVGGALGIAFIVWLVNYLYTLQKRRSRLVREKIREFCDKRGYTYLTSITRDMRYILGHTDLGFLESHTRADTGVEMLEDGFEMVAFRWVVMDQNRKILRQFFVMVAPFNFKKSGAISLRRYMGFEDRPGIIIKRHDLNFESQEFSKAFNVHAKPERFGYDLFTPRMCEIFLKHPTYEFYVNQNNIILAENIMDTDEKTIGMFSKEVPQIGWMIQTKKDMKKMIKRIPKFMGTKDPTPSENLVIECPMCEQEFGIGKGETNIKCPNCGAEGEL